MATRNDNWVYDGFESCIDGMNMSMEGEHLSQTQFFKGINVVTRKGVLTTRFALAGWEISDPAAYIGVFQGAFRYQLNNAEIITWVLSGRIYVLNLTTGALTDISTAFGVSMDMSARCYFCKAEKYLVIQDGINFPVYLDGIVAAAQMPGPNQVPIGTIMAYGHSRLFVVPVVEPISGEDGRRFIMAGDVYQPNNPTSVLTFTETDYYAGGGAFALPAEMGFIGGIGFMRNQNSDSGYGPMIVLARRGAVCFAVNEPRETLYDLVTRTVVREGWHDKDISQVLFQDVGSASPFSLLAVNADLLFRGNKDGMRSLSTTITEASTTLRNASLSGEMQDVFKDGGDSMLSQVSSAYSDNRIMFTVIPADSEDYFKAISSLDMNIINNVKQQLPPSFDGVFTGPRWLQILTAEYDGRDRLFAFVKTDTGMQLVYESDDAIADLDTYPINCRVYTRKFNFRRSDELKHLDHLKLWVSGIEHDVSMSVYVRTDDFPFWTQLDQTATFKAPTTGRDQQRRGVVFAANKKITDPIEGGDGLTGYVFQFCIVWSGYCKIKRGKARAVVVPELDDAATVRAEEDVELSDTGQLDLESSDYQNAW